MRTKNLVISVGALLTISGCAGSKPKQPETSGMKPDELAVYAGGQITVDDWSEWKKTSQMPATIAKDEEGRQFNEYLRARIDSLAARDEGITKDSTLLRRWLSIRQRIVSERYRVDILLEQFGVNDTAVAKYLASHPELASLPSDSARAKAVRAIALKGVNVDSLYQARKEHYKKDSTILPLDSVRSTVELDYLREQADRLTREFPDVARKLYKVEIKTPEAPEPPVESLKVVYERLKKDMYSEPAIFHMSALAAKDSATLAKALAKVKDEAGFQALAAKFPVGSPVAAPQGRIGRVKRQYALPFGIGLVPQLFNELDPPRTGLVAPLKVEDKWLAFWVSKVDSGAPRPFDAVKNDVAVQYRQEHPWTASPSAVVCTWDRGTLFTLSDVNFLAEEIPPHLRRQYNTQRLLDFMTLWAVVQRASEDGGHLARPAVKKAILDNERQYWGQEWRKSAKYQTFGLSKGRMDSALAANKALVSAPNFWLDTAGGIHRDAARLAIMPADFIASRYAENIDNYRRDSGFAPIDSVRGQVFGEGRAELDTRGQAHLDSTLRVRYRVKIAPTAPGQEAKPSAPVRLDTARALHDRRALDDAERTYTSVESDASAPDSLRAQALFQLGQLFGEQQNYPRSLSRYRAVLTRFPKSNEAYKAQFMIAFTYSEYLKLEKQSLPEYRKVLANYPKCDLADDADWMIRNIESGGALMPKFDDIDSTAKDSAKAKPAAEAPKAQAPAAAKAAEAPKAPAAAKPAAAPKAATKPASAPKADAKK